jgi:hypothetical protein
MPSRYFQATICGIEGHLFDSTPHRIEVQTAFTTPPPLETLRSLLFILMEESPNYKLMPVRIILSLRHDLLMRLSSGELLLFLLYNI